ncbi:MAG: lipopolysaccharide heptosyltransferase II [Nitrospira sp.]|nr:lipopolysaccharide heptosyltransferase II [Nitrospira sp.]
MFDRSCRNLLVRGVNWIGDGVMTLPALTALRKALPETKISILLKPWVAPVFENNPNIDEIILYDDKHKGIIGKLKLSRMLNKKDFCSAILLQNAFDAALITFLAGIKNRFGYNSDGRGFLLTSALPLPHTKDTTHQIYYYLNLVEQLGLKADYSEPYIFLKPEERLHAREMLNHMRKPILAVNPGATYGSAKRWFPDRFAEIANWFISDTGGSAIIFGGKTEVDIADEIYKKVIPGFRTPDSLLSLAGKTSLRELISLASECDVFVTNDSGPMHIAYAVRTPLIAIFGSTDPVLTGPPPGVDGNNYIVIKPDLSCSPCFERSCKTNDLRCMYAITSDEVYYDIKKILPNNPAVFFDRDGTLNHDTGYINTMDDFHIFTDIDNVRLLKEKGFKVIGISNQSGIARGIVNEAFVKEANSIFMQRFGFDDFYYCPHHPDEHCPCRKPEPEMLLRARAQHGINLRKSYIVGDKEADLLLAKAVGAKGILVQTGELKESEDADFTAKNLTEAVNWIIKQK